MFSPKDKIGDWLESYTKLMELNYWSGTECTGARWDDAQQQWNVTVQHKGESDHATAQAPGVRHRHERGAEPARAIPGMTAFKGTQVHSSQFKSGEEWRGKKAVVVGSNNSAHDICADLWEHGADVTMVQRSTTHVARSDSLMDLALGGLYSEAAVKAGIDTATADLIFASLPYKALPPLQVPVYQQMKERDAEFYARLEKAGFQLDFGDDELGPVHEVPAPRLGLLHRRRRQRAGGQRQRQAEERRDRARDREWPGDAGRQRTAAPT